MKKSMKTKIGKDFNEMHQTNLLSDGGESLVGLSFQSRRNSSE